MYLNRKRKGARYRYSLRQSVPDGERTVHRELFDLGQDPSTFIVYPGGHGFYFDSELVEALEQEGVEDVDRKLEDLFLPFLHPEIRRIVLQTTHGSGSKKPRLSKAAMEQRQAGLHVFDRRRLFYLRFGRMDSQETILKPHKFLNILLDKSRDEIENLFRNQEPGLRVREKKNYVFQALNLSRYFPGEIARLFPGSLDPETLDGVFLDEICALNQDAEYLVAPREEPHDPNTLSDYLVRYVIMWFDYDFGQKPPAAQLFDEFRRARAASGPPPRPTILLAQALSLFCLSESEWLALSKDEISRRYRQRAMECHPDQGGDPDRFIELSDAYERLTEGK